MVLTTHYLEEAEELVDRVGIINKGKLLLLEEKSALMRRLGERVLTVRFSTPVSALSPQVQGALSADGLRLDFIERHGTPTAASVLAAAFAGGMPVSDVSMQPAKLEDILLRVLNGTGAPAGNPGGAA